MILERMPEIRRLTAAQKFLLVSELWNDLAAQPANIPLPPEQVEELDRRLETYRHDPSQVTSWEAGQKRILGRTLPSE